MRHVGAIPVKSGMTVSGWSHHAVCIHTPAPEEEGDAPEDAAVQELVPPRRPVAECLVGARRPEESTLPTL
eukprot:5949143-Pleurochrysis_carterae.AAC.1